jgi:hypothetical protein
MKNNSPKITSPTDTGSGPHEIRTTPKIEVNSPQTELSGRNSATEDRVWEERLKRRENFRNFDHLIAGQIAALRGQNPDIELFEIVIFYFRERNKAEEQLRLLDHAEMQKMVEHELKDLPPISDSSMPKISLRMMVSTTLSIFPHVLGQGETPEEVSKVAAKTAWSIINDSWQLLASAEKRQRTLQVWADQDRTRLDYFRQERTVSWKEGHMVVTTYNSTDSPWRFREFLSAYYGQVLWNEKNTVFSSVQHRESAVAMDCGQWVSLMDEFFRTHHFTSEEVDFFRKTFEHYVSLGILSEKGRKDENTTTRPGNRTSKAKPDNGSLCRYNATKSCRH